MALFENDPTPCAVTVDVGAAEFEGNSNHRPFGADACVPGSIQSAFQLLCVLTRKI